MAVTLRHWIGGAALGCAALTVAFLPPRVRDRAEDRPWSPDRSTRATIANALRRDHQLALFFSRRDDALGQLHRAPAPSGAGVRAPRVLVDERRAGRVGARFRGVLEASADSLTQRYGPFDTTSRAIVFATADTEFKAPEASGWVGLGRWAFIFPEATDGRTCLVIAPWGRRAAGGPAVETNNLLGPCAYYAVFGMPGPGVSAWLRSIAYYPATEADWFTAPPHPEAFDIGEQLSQLTWGQAIAISTHSGLSLHASGCAAGRLERCAAYVGERPWFLVGRTRPSAFIAERGFFWGRGDALQGYLADLVREKGRDRFGRFWRSALPPDSAFAAAYGISMREWTHQWLADRHPGVTVGPAIRLTSILLGLLLTAVLVAAGAYYTLRRQVS